MEKYLENTVKNDINTRAAFINGTSLLNKTDNLLSDLETAEKLFKTIRFDGNTFDINSALLFGRSMREIVASEIEKRREGRSDWGENESIN